MTKVVVIEKFKKNWDIGSVVSVKDGYARNYLIPNGKFRLGCTATRAGPVDRTRHWDCPQWSSRILVSRGW